MCAPYAPRGDGDLSGRAVCARALKERGLSAAAVWAHDSEPMPVLWPRLQARRPRPSHIHAASVADIRRVLSFFGESCFYGLRSIELTAGGAPEVGASLRLGRLIVPGRIVLYDHAPSPWVLPGRLAPRERERLERSGALIETIGDGHQSVVTWPGTTLRDFMLFDVLMHEVGHHMVQQYTGKYRARVMRTADHEAFAERFAARCGRAYEGRQRTP